MHNLLVTCVLYMCLGVHTLAGSLSTGTVCLVGYCQHWIHSGTQVSSPNPMASSHKGGCVCNVIIACDEAKHYYRIWQSFMPSFKDKYMLGSLVVKIH